MKRLIARFQAWCKERIRKREWNEKKQVYYARIRINEDLRWLGNDPVARAICERHAMLLDDKWERHAIRNISDFRREIGLCPHANKDKP